MKTSEQHLSDARRQRTEAIVAGHMDALFRRLPMLSGFCLQPDLELAELSMLGWQGHAAEEALYEAVMQALADLADERPEAVQLMRGRTFARAVH